MTAAQNSDMLTGMEGYEVWASCSPVTFRGEVVDWVYGRLHYVLGGLTLCGKQVGGERWEPASWRSGRRVDCKTCLRKVGA